MEKHSKNLPFRINSQVFIELKGKECIISIPKIPTKPPFIAKTNSYDLYIYPKESLAYTLIDYFKSPRSFCQIQKKFSSEDDKEIESVFSDLESKKIIVPGLSLYEKKNYKKESCNTLAEKLSRKKIPLSNVLLIGGGNWQATVGLLYIASFLNQNHIATKIWTNREIEGYFELREHIKNLFSKVSYDLVGISYKWFHHVSNSLMLGALIHEMYPDVIIVYGGNSATLFKEDLLKFEFIDCLIMGDGEQPLLELCNGKSEIPNCALIEKGVLKETSQSYTQRGLDSEQIRLGDLEEICLSKKDLLESNATIVGGKGCEDNCFFCGGSRSNQIKIFKRPNSFLRPIQDVKNDIVQILPYHTAFMTDFSFLNVDLESYLRSLFTDIDLKQRGLRLVNWNIPDKSLIEFISSQFYSAWIQISVCCLSEKQRTYLWRQGYYKNAPTNKEILRFLDDCEQYSNIFSGVYSIFGLPFATAEDLEVENEFMDELAKRNSFIPESNLLLQAQPGAFLTENAQDFDMSVETKTFWDYLKYFEEKGQVGHLSLRIKYNDSDMDNKILKSAEEINKKLLKICPNIFNLDKMTNKQLLETKLVQENHLRFVMPESEWFGDHKRNKSFSENIVVLYKNMFDYYVHFNKDNMPFLKLNCDYDGYAIADEIISLFKNPSSINDTYQIVKEHHNISIEQFVEFIRLALKRFLLKISFE